MGAGWQGNMGHMGGERGQGDPMIHGRAPDMVKNMVFDCSRAKTREKTAAAAAAAATAAAAAAATAAAAAARNVAVVYRPPLLIKNAGEKKR